MQKKILRSVWLVLICGLTASFAFAKETELRGTFTLVKGKVFMQRAKEKTWRKVELYMPVGPSDRIKAEKKSEAEITFDDGTVLRIEPKTLISVEQAIIDRKTKKKLARLGLSSGRALTNVKKLVHPKSKFEFTTPTAVIAVRGTEFVVDAERLVTDVAVFAGEVGVSSATATGEVLVKEDYQTSVRRGEVPFPPSRLTKEFLRYRKQVVTKFEKRVARYRARLDKIKNERTKKIKEMKKESIERMEELRKRFEEKKQKFELK